MVDMKTLSLVLLTLQNSSQMLLMRFSLKTRGYAGSTAVVMQESIKLVLSFLFIMYIDGNTLSQAIDHIKRALVDRRVEMMKMAVPGLLYAVQNNLLYVAMSNLPGPTCAVLYQMKILTTAMFTVGFLGRPIPRQKWLALVVLFFGAAAVQYGTQGNAPSKLPSNRSQDPFKGFLAVVAACCTSGFAGVYLELMLKNLKSSLWVKNIQLATFGVAFGLAGVIMKDGEAVRRDGFFHGYSPVVWLVILDVSAGGLLVALVVKYADSIRKGFATSISIIISSVVSAMFLGFAFTPSFSMGTILVLSATLLYARPVPTPKPTATSDLEAAPPKDAES